MDDLVLYGGIGIAVLFLALVLLAAGIISGIFWIVSALLAGRFDLIAAAGAVLGVFLAGYLLTGYVLARLGIL